MMWISIAFSLLSPKGIRGCQLAAVPSRVDMQDYDSVYFGSKAPEEDSFSHIYIMVLELEPDLLQATGKRVGPW